MAIASEVSKKRKSSKQRTTIDISDLNTLKDYAASKGLDVKEKKPSIFVRAMDLLSRPVYASAGAAKALIKGNENPLGEAWKGLKGEEKETYSDVLKEAGVENKIARAVVGFGLDVALDPSTYLGGTLIKGALKGSKLVGKTALGTTRLVNPRLASAIEVTGVKIKDALGTAFDVNHGLSKTKNGMTLADDVNRYWNKLGIKTDETIETLNKSFESLPVEQHKEFARTLLDFRKQLPKLEKKLGSRDVAKKTLNELTPEFKTPEQLAFFNKTYKGIVDDMAKSAGLPEAERFKAYFPSIDKERLKPVLGGRVLSKTDENYKKLYKGLVEKELDKPIEALTRTQQKIFRDNMAKEMLDNAVKTYGKTKEAFAKLPKEQQALYKLIKDKQFGKEVGYLKEADFSFINNSMYPEMKTFDLLAKSLGFDFSNRIFKTAVTTYFPAFHIRNMISGGIQNYEVFGAAAFAPDVMPLIGKSGLSIMKGADKEIKLGKRIFNTKDLRKVLDENFGGTSRYIADLGDHIDDLLKGNYKPLSKMNPRRIGDFIEMNQKSNAMAMALKKGKSLDEAVKLAEKAGFNYQKLTKFESKVMRRAIPFYSFMRKNAELQVKTLINNPERILNQKKFADGLSNLFGEKMTEEELEGIPPWAVEGLGFKLKDGKYVASLGIPMEEFFSRVNNPLMSTLSSLSPVIKYPLESKLGYDFFREQKIIDLNKISPTSGELLMKAQESGKMPEWLSQAINIKSYVNAEGKTQYTMSPTALHKLRNLPTSRFENTFEKIFDKDLDTANKMAALFTGGKIYDIDIEKQKYFTDRDMRRDLEDMLLNIGEGDKYESFYIRK